MTARQSGIPRDAGHPVRYRIHNLASAIVLRLGEHWLRGTPYDRKGSWTDDLGI